MEAFISLMVLFDDFKDFPFFSYYSLILSDKDVVYFGIFKPYNPLSSACYPCPSLPQHVAPTFRSLLVGVIWALSTHRVSLGLSE